MTQLSLCGSHGSGYCTGLQPCSLWRTFFSSECCTDILNGWFYILLTNTKIGLKTFYGFPWALTVEGQL